MMKIVYLDCHTVNPGDLNWDGLDQLGVWECYERTAPEKVVERIGDAEVVITNKVRMDESILSQCPNLKLICVSATGYDVIDVVAAKKYGILVCNCAGYSTNAVAQMVVAHLLEVTNQVGHYSRRITENDEWVASCDFCYWNKPIIELEGLKVAIVGWGNIGKAVAERLLPFKVKISVVTSRPQDDLLPGVCKITMEQAFEECDVVSLNCPLTPQNAGFVNAELLNKSNPNLIIINTARGGLINEEDVAKALHEGKLMAYCTDVLTIEPARANNPLLKAPRVFMTPHIAWAAPGARRRIIQILKENILAYQAGSPISVVNG
jgi:glycerate dehydrogenase